MSILGQEKTSKLSTKGKNINNLSSLKNSKLHNEYSLDGSPSIVGKPSPSSLDPKQPKKRYIDNLPL